MKKRKLLIGLLIIVAVITFNYLAPKAYAEDSNGSTIEEAKEIQFASPKLKEYLLKYYDANSDGKITMYDMAQITNLSIAYVFNEQIDLQGLEYATSLESLEVGNAVNFKVLTNLQNLNYLYVNGIKTQEDYDCICKIPNLKQLRVENVDFKKKFKISQLPKQIEELCIEDNNYDLTQLDSIEGISQLQNLKKLSLTFYNGIKINKLEEINQLNNLEDLSINNNLTDLNFLQGNNTIKKLDASNNQLTDLSVIKENSTIEILNIEENQLTNLNFLQGNNTIKELNVSNNKLQDISGIENCTTMENLNISYNNLTKLDIDTLESLSNLKYCGIYENSIEDLSSLKNSSVLDKCGDIYQRFTLNTKVFLGKTTEIELPQLIKDLLNENDKFCLEDISISQSTNINGEQQEKNITSISENKNSLKIDATDTDFGNAEVTIHFWGNGKASGTELDLNCKILLEADQNHEVEFNSKKLKKYLLENYDCDEDGKITDLDMAQITSFDIEYEFEATVDLKGLEYAISLKSLEVKNVTNLKVLTNLQKLNYLSVSNVKTQEDYDSICSIPNLRQLSLGDNNYYNTNYYGKYDITKLPKQIEELTICSSNYNDNIQFGSIAGISEFKNLKKLKLIVYGAIGLNGLDEINKLSKLESLTIRNNLTNLNFLKNNNTIKELDLNENSLTDISAIKNNSTIERIYIINNNLTALDFNTLKSLKKLKELNIGYNNIEDLSDLKEANLLEKCSNISQNYTLKAEVILGKTVELQVPQFVRDCLKEDDEFYMKNIRLSQTTSADFDTEDKHIIKLSEDKKSLIVDASDIVNIGTVNEYVYLYGDENSPANGTTLNVNCKILADVDKSHEVQFSNNSLKEYLLKYYDCDNDGKITDFDMAQITSLNIANEFYDNEQIDLQGLEYAKFLKSLEVRDAVNLKVLTNLQNLNYIYVNGIETQEDYDSICKIPNLKQLRLENVNFKEKYDLKQLPKQVEELSITFNNRPTVQLDSIEGISKFENLNKLSMYAHSSENIVAIKGLEEINRLPKLEELCIENQLTDINFLRENNTIKTLNISYNQITDISPLKYNSKIENLNIAGNQLTNIDLISTLQNLKTIDFARNQIEDLSEIKQLDIVKNTSNIDQSYTFNLKLNLGEIQEIELAQFAKDCFNENDDLYIEDLNIYQFTTLDYNTCENHIAKISDDKEKLIIDTTGFEKGNIYEYISFNGVGKASGTNLAIYCETIASGDKNKEVEFEDNNLKQYILSNFDSDNDGKITEYDMAQITNLNYYSGVNSIKGLEFAKNLKQLCIRLNSKWTDGKEELVDVSLLGNLKKLQNLDLGGGIKNIDFIKKLDKIKTLNLEANNTNELLPTISTVNSIESLSLDDRNITTLEPITKLTNLKSLGLSSSLQKIDNLGSTLQKLSNLNYLNINRYEVYNEEAKQIDYSQIKNMKNLDYLRISDKYAKFNCSNIPANIVTVDLECDGVTNTIQLSKLQKVSSIYIRKSKLTDISFVKNLKLNSLDVSNNLITDLSPLENMTVNYITVTNNPINKEEAKNAKILKLYEDYHQGSIYITETAKSKKLDFTNKEFEKILLKNDDLNRDGGISIYEMEQVYSINGSKGLEYTEYLKNLNDVYFNELNLDAKEQEKLITEINKLNENVSINIISVWINLGEFKQSNTKKEFDLNKICPIYREMQNKGSRLYKGKLTLNDNEYLDSLEVNGNKILLNLDNVGEKNQGVSYKVEDNEYNYFRINIIWKSVADGSKTKVINIKDSKLKAKLLKDYDLDKDGKFTEYDANNISSLYIWDSGITDLTGIENLKNVSEIYADNNNISNVEPLRNMTKLNVLQISNNKISNIEPLMGLYNLTTVDAGYNYITDITCLKNKKFKTIDVIGLYGNYIDFSNDSAQTKTYITELNKDPNKEYNKAMLCDFATSQKIGTPSTQNTEVKMDAKIKQKLIKAGADLNNDGKLTQSELYEATNEKYDDNTWEYIEAKITSLDLSNLGLNNIDGIQYLVGLKELNLSHNKISNIKPLSKMMNLQRLDLSYNNISDISQLPNYAINYMYEAKNNEKYINLSHNLIKNISCINNWVITTNTAACGWQEGGDPNERVLNLDFSYNQIEDITPVKNYLSLKKLNLSNNKIKDISSLKDYNFKLNEYDGEDAEWVEALGEFKGIDLTSNYINVNNTNNKKAIQAFKIKKVTLNVANQKEAIFDDVTADDWYYTAVKYTYQKGIIKGATSTEFRPSAKFSRGMLVTILWRMEGEPKVTNAKEFADVTSGKYYYNAIKWATSKGIVNGYSNGKFGPEDNITREQLAVMLRNYAKYKGKNVSQTADISKYKDSGKTSGYAKTSVQWAIAKGIISGKDNGTRIDPQGTASRAEAAAMIYNYCIKIK